MYLLWLLLINAFWIFITEKNACMLIHLLILIGEKAIFKNHCCENMYFIKEEPHMN